MTRNYNIGRLTLSLHTDSMFKGLGAWCGRYGRNIGSLHILAWNLRIELAYFRRPK